jgi:hypothetical protein
MQLRSVSVQAALDVEVGTQRPAASRIYKRVAPVAVEVDQIHPLLEVVDELIAVSALAVGCPIHSRRVGSEMPSAAALAVTLRPSGRPAVADATAYARCSGEYRAAPHRRMCRIIEG